VGAVVAAAWTGARQRILALTGLALVVAVGVGVSLAAYEAAHRTRRAYPSYLREADVGELVVNPSLSTDRAEELITSTPGVLDHRTDDLLSATFDDGEPRTQAAVDSVTTQVRMSSDGRYADQDRPVVHEGRMLRTGAREAFLSREAAEGLGVSVGDELPLAFWVNSYNTPGVGAGQGDLVEPIGRTSARVVGIGVLPDEVLVDELYPRQRVLVTPEVGAPYTCTLRPIDPDDDRPIEELVPSIVPDGCAMAYRYFSLRIAGGDGGVARVADALTATFEEENTRIPEALREQDVGYLVIPSATRDQRDRVERSISPAVTALRSFALAAGVATVVVASLGALRIARRDSTHTGTWRSLGMTRAQRLLAIGAPLGAAVVVGTAAAVAIGFLLSGFGPVASVRAVEPATRLGLGGHVLLVVIGVAGGLLLAGVALAAAAVVRTMPEPAPRRRSLLGAATSVLEPARGLGVRAAARGAGAGAVLVGSTAAVGVVLAGLVFTSSLSGLVGKPARYGWPYDAAVMVGFGYGGAVPDAIARSLDRPEVDGWGLASLGSVTIDGETIAGVAARERFASLPVAAIEGQLPVEAEEIAIGVQTAEELGIDVGDRVALGSYFGERDATVTGTVVLPPVGPFESDRAATGTGALLSEPFFRALVAAAEDANGLEPGSFDETGLGSFVAVDLARGVDPSAFLESIQGELLSWDRNGFVSLTYPEPARPSAIADLAGMRRLPLALGAFFALTMAGGYAIGIAVATRARRRELGVLAALGGSPRQLAASVRWHALTVACVALLVGTPLGIAAGRTLYRAFAVDLGVLPDIAVPVGWTAVVAVVTVVIGLLASAAPARSAARPPASTMLRSE
jgi:hypothetical protein